MIAKRSKRPSFLSSSVLTRIPGILLPMLAILVSGVIVAYSRDRVRDRYLVRQRSEDMVRLHRRMIGRELDSVTATLIHFANQDVLRRFLQDPSTRATLEAEYVHFARVSGHFDQVRLIDLAGQEVLRVNYNAGAPAAVPVEGLQSKMDRYYVRRTQPLPAGRVYISPFDLNLEHGEIQEPWQPVVRLATPVFDGSGVKRGILVFNFLGRTLLERLATLAAQAPGRTWLVNQDGYYLEGPDPARSWGFMFGREPTFGADHPDAWTAIRDRREGSFSTDEGMFTFDTITPPGNLRDAVESFPDRLKVVSFVPTPVVYGASWATLERLIMGTAVVAVILLGISWRLAFVGAVRDQHEREVIASERRLRRLSRKLLDAQELERKSLARDLHDEVGQLATAVTIDLKRARRSEDPAAKEELVELALETTGRLLESLHRISARTRSSLLDDLGLEAALRSMAEEFEQRTGIRVELELAFDAMGVVDTVGENVYRILQEALTNVSRHSRSEEVRIRLVQLADQLFLSVEDTGVGFDLAEADTSRHGLLGMRERTELLGGVFEVDSNPGEGTHVQATLPMDGNIEDEELDES